MRQQLQAVGKLRDARRDLAVLGLIHRTALGKGPAHFRFFFEAAKREEQAHLTRYTKRRHREQLEDWRVGRFSELLRRSALGLVSVYNLLPEELVCEKEVKSFQSKLQEVLKQRAAAGCEDWKETFSPRVPLWKHPLR